MKCALSSLLAVAFGCPAALAAPPSAPQGVEVLDLDLDLVRMEGRLGDHGFSIPHAELVATWDRHGVIVIDPRAVLVWSPKSWRLSVRGFDAKGALIGEDPSGGPGMPPVEQHSASWAPRAASIEVGFWVDTPAERVEAPRVLIRKAGTAPQMARAPRAWLEIDGRRNELPIVSGRARVSIDLDVPARVRIGVELADGGRAVLERVVLAKGQVLRPDARKPVPVSVELRPRRLRLGRSKYELPPSDPIVRGLSSKLVQDRAVLDVTVGRPAGTGNFVVHLEDAEGREIARAHGIGSGESSVSLESAASLLRAGAWLYVEADHSSGVRMLGPRVWLPPWELRSRGTLGSSFEPVMKAGEKLGPDAVLCLASPSPDRLKEGAANWQRAGRPADRLVTELDPSLEDELIWSWWMVPAPSASEEGLQPEVRPLHGAAGEKAELDASGRILRVGRAPGPELIVPLPALYSAPRVEAPGATTP